MQSFVFAPEKASLGQRTTGNRGFLTENLYSRKEVCETLKIGYRTFTRLRSTGDGPSVVWVGGRQMFTATEIQRWLRSRTEYEGRPYQIRGNYAQAS